MKTLLVTGGCGFIGSNFIDYLLKNTDYAIICFDALTYAGKITNIEHNYLNSKFFVEIGNICDKERLRSLFCKFNIDGIINFAAESHVDNSIKNPQIFIETNIMGTMNLLEKARLYKIRHLQISTDEVYGSLGPEDLPATENNKIITSSPYSASKASADLLTLSYIRTFNIDAVITRCSNNYGPRQLPEKLIPLTINHALSNNKIPIYGNGMQIRDWIHVNDHCRGILMAFEKGKSGEIYNFGGNNQLTNLDIVKTILKLCNKSENLIEYVADRPGHDIRYAIDFTKSLKELNWKPLENFSSGIEKTVNWYKNFRNSN